MSKTHLVISAESVKQKQPCTALCGVEIQSADIWRFWDETAMGGLLVAPRGTCSACDGLLQTSRSKGYVFGCRDYANRRYAKGRNGEVECQ
jgi:hypothetical protein